MAGPKSVLPLADASAGMMRREVTVVAADVVFVKGIVEASEGVGVVFAERGGDLSIVSPREREAEVAELVEDLRQDVAARVSPAVFVSVGLASAGPASAGLASGPASAGKGQRRGVELGRNELG